MNDAAPTNPAPPLWVTMRGARAGLALGWVAWVATAALGAWARAPFAGPPGALVGILTAGWLLARRQASPLECLRRYHLDDVRR
jgi:hypothetical protein